MKDISNNIWGSHDYLFKLGDEFPRLVAIYDMITTLRTTMTMIPGRF